MGFINRLFGKNHTPPPAPAVAPAAPKAEPDPAPAPGTAEPVLAARAVMPRLVAARALLDEKDLAGALAIYERVLASAGERADVLVTISGDLGATGHLKEIIDLVAPRYAADVHGPATGLNVLQAYIALRNAEAAQHLLDILFSLGRPELEDRLHGLSKAIADLLTEDHSLHPGPNGTAHAPLPPEKVDLISISKPVWFYGLEPMAAQILPEKAARPRRIAFAQLAVLGLPDVAEQMTKPEEELGRLSRAVPLWLAETFSFSSHYAPIAVVGVLQKHHFAIFSRDWTPENLRELIATTEGGLDFIVTGAVRRNAGDFELLIRVLETKKLRERKQFTARWSPATATAKLTQLHEQIRLFMEWSPAPTGLTYTPPAAPAAWLDTLASSLSLFLAEKNLLAAEQLASPDELLAPAVAGAATGEAASLAFLTSRNRAQRLSLAVDLPAILATSPLITQATALTD